MLADCQEIDDPSDASLNCAPTVMPDETDQLTEQEVAEPGFNGGNESHNGAPVVAVPAAVAAVGIADSSGLHLLGVRLVLRDGLP